MLRGTYTKRLLIDINQTATLKHPYHLNFTFEEKAKLFLKYVILSNSFWSIHTITNNFFLILPHETVSNTSLSLVHFIFHTNSTLKWFIFSLSPFCVYNHKLVTFLVYTQSLLLKTLHLVWNWVTAYVYITVQALMHIPAFSVAHYMPSVK